MFQNIFILYVQVVKALPVFYYENLPLVESIRKLVFDQSNRCVRIKFSSYLQKLSNFMKPEISTQFVLNNEQFLRLPQIDQSFTCRIKVEDQVFSFNLEQIFILSIPIYKYFLTHTKSFLISARNSNFPKFLSSDQLISCFSQIHSLFFSKSEVEFLQADQPYIEFLTTIFDNQSLLQLSRQLKLWGKKYFSFNSLRFRDISQVYRDKIKNFSIIINDTSFQCNSMFFSCFQHFTK
jgi:hypothetical protein